MIDLKPFCLDEDFPDRNGLKRPFSQGGNTYATNGDILIRVPHRENVTKSEKPNLENVYHDAGPMPAAMMPLRLKLPDPELGGCEECEGRGTEHDCPDCECECEVCDGKGEVTLDVSLTIRGVIFDAKYIRLIQSLPAARLAQNPSPDGPTWFAFDGGDGLIMPMRRPHERHIAKPEELP